MIFLAIGAAGPAAGFVVPELAKRAALSGVTAMFYIAPA